MNRRSFLGTLLAAPVAAVMGLKRKGPVDFWGHELVKRHRGPTMTPRQWSKVVGEVKYNKAFLAQAGEEFGNSFAFLKSQAASEIMAKNDRRTIRRWRDYGKNQ